MSDKRVVRMSRKNASDDVVVETLGFLEQDAFTSLHATLDRHFARAEVSKDGRKSSSFPLASLPQVLSDLRSLGLECDLTSELVGVVRSRAEAARTQLATSDERIVRLRSKLLERGEAMRQFQERGVAFLHASDRAILADDLGLGKTCQTILAIPEGGRAIWVTRVSLVDDACHAVSRWRPDLRWSLIEHGIPKWPAANQVFVCSYDCVPEAAELCSDKVPDLLVLVADEAKTVKGDPNVGRVRRFRSLSRAVGKNPLSRRWLLEGTPLINRLDELWNMLENIELGKELFGSKARFRKLAREDRPALVAILRRVMLRREMDEVRPDMPRTTRSEHLVQIGARERAELDNLLELIRQAAGQKAVDALFVELAPDSAPSPDAVDRARTEAHANVDAAIALAFDGKLPIPFEFTSRVKSILALAKSRHSCAYLRDVAPTMDEHGQVIGRPMLFFSEHVLPVQEVAASVPGAQTMTGETSRENRASIVREFKAGRVPLLCMTGEVGGSGLNLPEASTGVWNDLPWSYALANQQEGRMRRDGQTDDRVQAVRVVVDHPIDRRILELITEKQELSQSTVGRTTILGKEGSAERPDSLARALENVLLQTREVADPPPSPAVAPSSDDERWVAHVLRERADLCKKHDSSKALRVAIEEQHGKLTKAQWSAATSWNRSRTSTRPDAFGRRQCVSAEEKATRTQLLLLAGREYKGVSVDELELISRLYRGASDVGLTDGEWILARFVTRKHKEEVS